MPAEHEEAFLNRTPGEMKIKPLFQRTIISMTEDDAHGEVLRFFQEHPPKTSFTTTARSFASFVSNIAPTGRAKRRRSFSTVQLSRSFLRMLPRLKRNASFDNSKFSFGTANGRFPEDPDGSSDLFSFVNCRAKATPTRAKEADGATGWGCPERELFHFLQESSIDTADAVLDRELGNIVFPDALEWWKQNHSKFPTSS